LDFPNTTVYPPTNNIFINATLFDEYYSFLNTNVGPQLNQQSFDFLPVNDTNQAQAVNTSFLQSYLCLKRVRKEILELIVLVLSADYALFMGPLGYIMFCASWWSKRKDNGYQPRGATLMIRKLL
jgi:hypothetical protein